MNSPSPLTRRAVISLGGATVLGAGAVALAACSTGVSAAGSAARGPAFAKGTTVSSLAEIPVGGTASATVNGEPLLLAQPTAGKVVCFSAICTHQGCTVAAAATDFECPCHGSTFAAANGAVTNGPAVNPLAEVAVKISGDAVVIA